MSGIVCSGRHRSRSAASHFFAATE
jgi:hypothetical protein